MAARECPFLCRYPWVEEHQVFMNLILPLFVLSFERQSCFKCDFFKFFFFFFSDFLLSLHEIKRADRKTNSS